MTKLSFCTLYFLSVMSVAYGLEVTMGQTSVEVARGEDVTISCHYKPKKPVNDLVIITWSGEATETEKNKVVIGTHYSNGDVDIGKDYQGKASIKTDFPATTSSLTLTKVTLKESRPIRCYIQIPGDSEGTLFAFTSLLVQVPPSQPICRTTGKAEYGHNITLTCVSEESSPAATYKWETFNVKNEPRPHPPKTIERDGVLSLFNASMETSGFFVCLSSNQVGSAKCNVTLSVVPPSMNLATIGIAAGCIAGVVVLIIIICCCCRKKRKQNPEEYEVGPTVVEYHDKLVEEGNTDQIMTSAETRIDKTNDEEVSNHNDGRRSSRDELKDNYNDHRSSRDELRSDKADCRGSRDDLKDHYNDRKGSRDDLRDQYDDRRVRYDDRKGSRDDLRDHHYDRRQDDVRGRDGDLRSSCDNLRDNYNDRRGSRDELRDHYDDRRGSRDELRDHYDDRRGSRDNLRDNYDDRRSSRDNLRDNYRGSRDELRDHYDDRRGSRDDLYRDRYR